MPSPRVCVVGAGIIGCAIGWELARRGARVTLLERRSPGRGATQASAGILSPYVEARPDSPLLDLGVRSLEMYPEFVARVRQESGESVLFEVCGTLEVAASADQAARFADAASHRQRFIGPDDLVALEPALADGFAGGLLVEEHAYVAANQLALAMVRAAGHRNATLRTGCEVRAIERAAGCLSVVLEDEAIAADFVVLAAGSWSGGVEIPGVPPLPVHPVRGQLVQLVFPTGRPIGRIVWSSECYLVPWPDGRLLVGATVEPVGFDERPTAAGVGSLLSAAQALIPSAGGATWGEVRVGLRPATPDELPIVGFCETVPGLLFATGHYRNGILLTPLTASLVADLMMREVEDPALRVMRPGRFGGSHQARLE